jgi:hypothetical protein
MATSDIQSIANSLIARAQKTDPVIMDILQLLLDETRRLGIIIDPPPSVGGKIGSGIAALSPPNVLVFTYELTRTNLILRWEPPTVDFILYEIRKGTVWDTATRILTTTTLQAILDPIAVGIHTYLIKTISTGLGAGIYSQIAKSLDVIIPQLGSILIVPNVIDQNVLLNWTIPTTTFEIEHYDVSRQGVFFSTSRSNFHVILESTGGKFTYGITPVDIAGNRGQESTVTVELAPPKDFVLINTQISSFNGTKVNAFVGSGRLLVPVNVTETYQAHFTTRSWASPQAQINAGYPRWLTPTPLTASYEQVFDFGTILGSTIITLSWLYEIITGEFTIGTQSQTSIDGTNYSSIFSTPSFYATSVRYLKVKINFTGSNDKALMWFYNFMVSASVKVEMDSGFATAFASDATGTVVNFKKAFKDVEGITIAPMSTTTVIPIVDFVDIANPVFFKVYIFDNSGIRITRDFRWDARGVL